MRNTGLKAEDDFKKILSEKHPKSFLYKITDTHSAGKLVKPTPADNVLTIDGRMAYAEVKSCSNKTSFPFSQFSPTQKSAMVLQTRAGGSYWIFILNTNTQKWYWIEAHLVVQTLKAGNKSLKWSEIEGYFWAYNQQGNIK